MFIKLCGFVTSVSKKMLNIICHSTSNHMKDILLFSDIIEEQSLRDSTTSTVKSDDVALSPDEGKPVLQSQLSKTEEKPVTYHADFEMPVFNIQVHS